MTAKPTGELLPNEPRRSSSFNVEAWESGANEPVVSQATLVQVRPSRLARLMLLVVGAIAVLALLAVVIFAGREVGNRLGRFASATKTPLTLKVVTSTLFPTTAPVASAPSTAEPPSPNLPVQVLD